MEFSRGAMECFCSRINDLAEQDTAIHGFFVLCVFWDDLDTPGRCSALVDGRALATERHEGP